MVLLPTIHSMLMGPLLPINHSLHTGNNLRMASSLPTTNHRITFLRTSLPLRMASQHMVALQAINNRLMVEGHLHSAQTPMAAVHLKAIQARRIMVPQEAHHRLQWERVPNTVKDLLKAVEIGNPRNQCDLMKTYESICRYFWVRMAINLIFYVDSLRAVSTRHSFECQIVPAFSKGTLN